MAKVLLLIVEDELALAEMYAANFKSAGFDVDVAHDGREGFDKMVSEHPNLVLMDILMPGISGLETLEKAKSEPRTKDIPIIMLTNLSGSAVEIKNAMQEGAVDFVVKSELTPSQVVDKAKKVLGLNNSPENTSGDNTKTDDHPHKYLTS